MQDASQEEPAQADQPWRTPLDDLERTLQEVGRAIGALRDALEGSDRDVAIPLLRVVEPESRDDAPDDSQARATEGAQPSANVAEADVAETDVQNTPASPKPEPTEFQKVWDRHKQEPPEGGKAPADAVEEAKGGDHTGQEAEGSFGWNADEESPPEDQASQPAGFQQVWERLRQDRGIDESREGDTDSPPADAAGVSGVGAGNFDRVWERLSREREGRSEEGAESTPEPRGLGSMLKEYRMTIEDRDGTPVDLVALHRALMAFAAADDISLVGYAKGTAVVGLRTEGELDLDRLASVIGAATTRQCEVIPQDQGKLFLRLSGEEEGAG